MTLLMIFFGLAGLLAAFCAFFDQAVLTRKGTVFRVPTQHKRVALTFDDGPSRQWTPQVLDALKVAGIPATFFMVGYHVRQYPDIARRVAAAGHEIANHGFAHSVILYYTPAEIEEEIKYSEQVIREVTGRTTRLFRPPKAWLRAEIKDKIKDMGYRVVLWSLNSKDWVKFDHRAIVHFICRRIQSGDILLFHDSGSVFGTEGGDRSQTVAAIPLLAQALRAKGYEFVTVSELIESQDQRQLPGFREQDSCENASCPQETLSAMG